jgi:transcriptional regulator with XRE-family HTH domain
MKENNQVGSKIISIRQIKNISADELAARCGFSLTTMEKIEKGETLPSLGHLIKVSRALGVRLGTFLDDQDLIGPVISRQGEAQVGTGFSTSNNEAGSGLTFHPLAGDKSGRHFEPFIIDIAPSRVSTTHLSAHEGEEFIYVLSGKIEIAYGKEKYQLAQGDSIYYDSIVDHHVHSANGEAAKILAVVYAPF